MVFEYVWLYVDLDIKLYSILREEREVMVELAASFTSPSSAPLTLISLSIRDIGCTITDSTMPAELS
jgi:hypothetical protein